MDDRPIKATRPAFAAPGEGPRRSACAADARRREAARILAMTPRERAELALELGRRYAAFARESR